jgi:hypothetical protein
MIIYVETFKTNVIVFFGNIIMSLMSDSPIIYSIRESSMILIIINSVEKCPNYG